MHVGRVRCHIGNEAQLSQQYNIMYTKIIQNTGNILCIFTTRVTTYNIWLTLLDKRDTGTWIVIPTQLLLLKIFQATE